MIYDLFEEHNTLVSNWLGPGVEEGEAAARIGVSKQTLRNLRLGYTNAYRYYPAKLTEGKEWRKERDSKRSPVLFDPAWVDKLEQIKKQQEEVWTQD